MPTPIPLKQMSYDWIPFRLPSPTSVDALSGFGILHENGPHTRGRYVRILGLRSPHERMGSTRKALISRKVVVVQVIQHGLRALCIDPYFMVQKIRWNENCPRVTSRRPFVCDTKRSVPEAQQGSLVEERYVRIYVMMLL